MVEIETAFFDATDGYRLAYRRARPPGGARPRAIVVYLHGIQSHGGWYAASIRHLAEAGFAVYFPDRRGSGLNQYDRGHAPSWERLAQDVTELEDLALADYRGTAAGQSANPPASHSPRLPAGPPLVLLGVSWGGKLASALAAMHDARYRGLALLCPGLCPQRSITLAARVRIALAMATGRERKLFDLPLNDANLFTATPRWLAFLRHDELSLRQATARLLFESRRLDDFMAEAGPWIHVPVYLALAGRDSIIDNAATWGSFAGFGSSDKWLRLYTEACHTLEFEPQPAPIFDDLTEWLRAVTA